MIYKYTYDFKDTREKIKFPVWESDSMVSINKNQCLMRWHKNYLGQPQKDPRYTPATEEEIKLFHLVQKLNNL